MEYGIWKTRDSSKDFIEVLAPHPSGKGLQSLGYFRKADLMPIVNLIVAAPDLYKACLSALGIMATLDQSKGWVKEISGVIQKALTKAEGKQ